MNASRSSPPRSLALWLRRWINCRRQGSRPTSGCSSPSWPWSRSSRSQVSPPALQIRGMRPFTALWAAWLLPAALAAGGCAAYTLRTPDPGPQAHVLTGVPVRSFGLKSCGAGSLSAVLGYHGEPVTLEELDTVLPKGRNDGVVTLDLVLEARRRGYDARLVEGTPELVERELLEGRPVILMLEVLDAPGQRRDLYHYIVADGVEPSSGRVRVQLGDGKQRWTTFERLDNAWRSTRRTTLLIAPGALGARAAAAQNSLRYAV